MSESRTAPVRSPTVRVVARSASVVLLLLIWPAWAIEHLTIEEIDGVRVENQEPASGFRVIRELGIFRYRTSESTTWDGRVTEGDYRVVSRWRLFATILLSAVLCVGASGLWILSNRSRSISST